MDSSLPVDELKITSFSFLITHFSFVGSTRWIKRIMILRPIKTANTIDILISMIMSGFVVTGCPIKLPPLPIRR